MAIKVITDSTSDLPLDIAESLGIEVVPLNVHFGAEVYKDRVDLMPGRFYDMLINGDVFPTTSQPSVGDFIDVYERFAHDADGIVSVHVSEKVSGTMNSARLASQQAKADCPIEVVDTYQASMGVGMIAMEAARVANSGGDMNEVTLAARNAVTRCQCFVLLDTLEYLQKGGRIGKAQAMLGNLLRIRPLIIVQEGEVHPLGKERTRRKGIAKLVSTATEFAPISGMAVMYSTSPDEAQAVAQDLSRLMEGDQEPMTLQFGPTLGTYVGPDALGIGLLSAKSG
ncbi:MAG: DegV family protein [SAR202 cluster bacterium]|jgi:DegV family protein with EDD domain|nr:DegV family protein [SAR202 cluster bacterium]MDP6512230.1 DegV family protein [SAR202 cluster bacterium]MDP6715849.1 DegV family protein [SAR202 cluster bacterium]